MDNSLDYSALGSRVKREREKQQLTQEQLAEMCSLSTSHVGHIERGTRIPSVEVLYKISCSLNISIDSLVFDSFENSNSLFVNIESMINKKDQNKVNTFINTVKILADNIDKF